MSDSVNYEALVETLRDVAQAYPEDVFLPLTDAERTEHSVVITRAAGSMGRFLSKHMTAAADAIEQLERERDEARELIMQELALVEISFRCEDDVIQRESLVSRIERLQNFLAKHAVKP